MALSGSQTSFSGVQRRLWLAKTPAGPNTHRRNMRHRFHEPATVGPNAQTQGLRVGLLLPVLVATEDDRLIANKGPPGLGWPSAWWRQVARHGGLGHAEAEHAKLAMDPRRTPKKVLTGHPRDQISDLPGNPGTSTRQRQRDRYPPNRRLAVTAPTQDRIGLNDHQAFAPTSPPARQQNPKQSINATEARAPGSATLHHGDLMAQRDRFKPQRGAGPGFASGDRHRSVLRLCHQRTLSPDVQNHQ